MFGEDMDLVNRPIELFVFIPSGMRSDGMSGWVKTGDYETKEEALSVMRFAQGHNPAAHYEIRTRDTLKGEEV